MLVAAAMLAVALFGLAAYAVSSLPSFGGGPALGTPVRWSGLPTPVVTRPQWTSHTYAGPVRDLALGDGLLWAATDGGLVVWDSLGEAARFTVEHGLAANRVTSVTLGLDGAVWAGTVAGLSRYDGRNWRSFTTADGLPDSAIRDVAVDREGTVWVATAAGLARYDGRGWQTFDARGLRAELPSDNVLALAVDRANRLWAGTDAGLARLERGRWRTYTTADGLPDPTVTTLAVSADDLLWLATPAGLARTDGLTFDTYLPGADATGIVEGLSYNALAPLPDGTVAVALGGDLPYLLYFNPAAGRSKTVAPPQSVGAAITSLLIDVSGRLWAGAGDSVWRVDDPGETMLVGPSDLPAANVNDMVFAGNALWAATPSGVARFDGRWQWFNAADGLGDNAVSALAEAPDGSVWAAFDTPLRGLSRYADDGWRTLTCPTAAPTGARVLAAAQTPEALWFATEAGVSRFDGAAWQAYGVSDGLPGGPIIALVADGEAVWAGNENGVARLEGETWKQVSAAPVERLAVAPGQPPWAWGGGRLYRLGDAEPGAALPLPTAVRALAATGGAAWLATADGVLRYDGDWSVYTTDDGLPTTDVTAITVAAGQVWAAASGDSGPIELVQFDGARWQPHPSRDPAAEQLTDNIVRGVAIAPDGDVWLATPAGINRQRDGHWLDYTVAAGLPGDDVRGVAWTLDALWAATSGGLARYDGREWAAFGAPSSDQPGPPVAMLAVGFDGTLWTVLDPGWPNALRGWDGQRWVVAPLPAPDAVVRQLTAGPSGLLVALIESAGRTSLGIYSGGNWVWQAADDLPLRVDRMAVAPDGTLWVTGSEPIRGGVAGDSLIAAFEIGPAGLGREIGRFVTAEAGEFASPGFLSGGTGAPFAFAADGRVYAGGAGAVYIFNGEEGELVPQTVLDVPLPFSRHTFAVALGPEGELWVGTERGAAVWRGTEWQEYYATGRAPEWWGSARALFPRPDGGILLGTAGGGIGLYTGRAFDGVLRPSQGPREWVGAFHPVTSVLLADDGVLWAGSDGGGVARFTAGAWDVLAPDPVLIAPTRTLVVTEGTAWAGTEAGWTSIGSLTADACRFMRVEPGSAVGSAMRDGQAVWLATVDDGAIRIVEGSEATRELTGAAIAAVARAPNGDVWFANSRQPWLTRYRSGGEGWTRLPLDLRVVEPAVVTSLAVSSNLDLWLGTREGLVRFSSGQWSKLTTVDGLPDDDVRRVLVAPDGAIWAVTGSGVVRWQP